MKMKSLSRPIGALLLLSLLASCGEGSRPADTTAPAVPGTPDDGTVSDSGSETDDELGSYNFEGYEFRILTSSGQSKYYYTEEIIGDVVNDAVYKRNRAVEDRFNCRIRVIDDRAPGETEIITNSIASNEDAMDLICWENIQLSGLVSSDLFLNWYDIPAVNFDKPWWANSSRDDLSVNGYCPLAIGDLLLSAISNAYSVFYNKTIGEDYQIPDVYEIVRSGQWTFDRLLGLTKDIHRDLNNNNEVDDTDFFGYASDCHSNMGAYLWAFDNSIFTQTKDGPEFSLDMEKMTDIAKRLNDAFTSNTGVRTLRADEYNWSFFKFADSEALFANSWIGLALQLRDMEDDYAILPYPKWDEDQEAYYASVDAAHQTMAVPVTVSDSEKVGVITEALCAKSYKTVIPAYYDLALKTKGTRDEESVEMIDLVVRSRIFDFGYVYDNWKGASFLLETLVLQGSSDFASLWASRKDAIMAHYGEVIGYFERQGE